MCWQQRTRTSRSHSKRDKRALDKFMGTSKAVDDSGQAHLRLCANKHAWIALIFVAFSALELVLSWRPLVRDNPHDRNWALIMGLIVTIAVLGQLLVVFKCLRERLVLCLAIASFARGLLLLLVPPLAVRLSAKLITGGNIVLWTVATMLSLSILLSSLRQKRLT
jgi:hypothetical protein